MSVSANFLTSPTNNPKPLTVSAIARAKLFIESAAFSIDLSLPKVVNASTKPLPIISVASAAATFNKSILPA